MIALVTGQQQEPDFCRMLGCVWVEERESLHIDVSNFQREVKE